MTTAPLRGRRPILLNISIAFRIIDLGLAFLTLGPTAFRHAFFRSGKVTAAGSNLQFEI